jgi:ribonuclease HI
MPKGFVAYFDGASKGNPGPAGIGGVILDGTRVVGEISKSIGTATNNQAEYEALLEVLRKAKELGVEWLSVFSDSELVVRQLNGQYRIKDPKLRVLYHQASELRAFFKKITFHHVPREKNKHADALANLGVANGRASAD